MPKGTAYLLIPFDSFSQSFVFGFVFSAQFFAHHVYNLRMITKILAVGILAFGLSLAALADEAKLKVDTSSTEDTSILVHKGPIPLVSPSPMELKIMEESDEITGDPDSDRLTAYKSWKEACAQWKKELKENNGKNLISSSCGTPHVNQDSVTFAKTNVSTGTYKLKVSIKDTN
jgi:hypothetical protein